MSKTPKLCGECDAYANPADNVDRLGRVFTTLKIHERYGITFERWMYLVETGAWVEYVA